jgi:hypothetical protein
MIMSFSETGLPVARQTLTADIKLFSMSRKLLNGGVYAPLFLIILGGSGCRLAMMSALGSLGAVGAVAFHIIAVHEATERQRQVAEQQARFAYSQMPIAQRAVRRQRYIAVATVREPTSTGAKSLMVFDTKTDQLVGNHVYDVDVQPKTGQVGKFETYSAEYVGTGQY